MRMAALASLLIPLANPVPWNAQEPVDADVKKEAQVVEASALRVEALLGDWEAAEDSGDALALAAVLLEMAAHSNSEFTAPGLDGLKYRASRFDRGAAKDEAAALGEVGKEAVAARVDAREAAVQVAAATLLGSAHGKRNGKALRRLLEDEEVLETRPQVIRAVVDALGRLDDHDAEDLVRAVLETWGDARVSQACVLYFGKVRTKRYEHVRYLCTLLKAPAPEDVHDASNPPAEYWEKRWKTWQLLRRDVTWTLQQVTGQAFLAQEGDRPADTERALQWIEEHRKELGLE